MRLPTNSNLFYAREESIQRLCANNTANTRASARLLRAASQTDAISDLSGEYRLRVQLAAYVLTKRV
jgi:hypothetical protein